MKLEMASPSDEDVKTNVPLTNENQQTGSSSTGSKLSNMITSRLKKHKGHQVCKPRNTKTVFVNQMSELHSRISLIPATDVQTYRNVKEKLQTEVQQRSLGFGKFSCIRTAHSICINVNMHQTHGRWGTVSPKVRN